MTTLNAIALGALAGWALLECANRFDAWLATRHPLPAPQATDPRLWAEPEEPEPVEHHPLHVTEAWGGPLDGGLLTGLPDLRPGDRAVVLSAVGPDGREHWYRCEVQEVAGVRRWASAALYLPSPPTA